MELREDHAILLFQSVRELLMNVVKHAGTTEATLTIALQKNVLSLTVSDQGRGFDVTPEQGTTDTHFGLFSIRERMEAIEGTVEITSTPNQGTTASLKLSLAPLETATQSDKTLRVSAAQSANTPDVRILMVDDHPLVRQGMRGVMDGFQNMHIIGGAADGREAVQLAESLRPDVVIMDVNMPNMDGVEATRLIKQNCPKTLLNRHDSLERLNRFI